MRRKLLCLFGAGAAAAAAFLQAAPASLDNLRNALDVIDGYLARAASSNPIYRADLRPGGDPNNLPAGRQFARGAWLGPFTYRAKTYRELTPAERAALLGDPNFRAYIAAATFRRGNTAIAIPPAEMLKPGPFIVALPAPFPP